ncbi:hypothetical protein SAMN04488069_1382 [Hymenobacter psychrophilus]|uniref:Uncharacterized protein n=1 Tax=Hymenobacter psychrophilus TaxID=651662 RepID=A0A1H3PKQ7_9BACT|nr:hypothetical protein SAMN04488069_1382 [Hymenobacter psychrophilus]
MKPPKFHPGQAVVCIKANWPLLHDDGHTPMPLAFPQRGGIYHVDGVFTGSADHIRHMWFVTLIETGGTGNAFWEENFALAEELPAEALAELLEESFTPTVAV